LGENSYELTVDHSPDGALILHLPNERVVTARVVQNNGFHVWANGHTARFGKSGAATRSGHDDAGTLDAPMPGTVLKVHVAVGDVVTENQILVVVEAMKMEHAVRAPKDATVARICFNEGAPVAQGDILVEME
ncbi:MAG TPA: acetyl-CoA carboxylase biotin carboxyl carrier protein subunit, partial [Myxococcales bacterium]|nr:acetyl-CoA carboxylase biotin carboxyl carrier protein subunit [Myxococcales bacterium]